MYSALEVEYRYFITSGIVEFTLLVFHSRCCKDYIKYITHTNIWVKEWHTNWKWQMTRTQHFWVICFIAKSVEFVDIPTFQEYKDPQLKAMTVKGLKINSDKHQS